MQFKKKIFYIISYADKNGHKPLAVEPHHIRPLRKFLLASRELDIPKTK